MTPSEVKLDAAQIARIMPMQDPFLFVQSAVVSAQEATGTYHISGKEDFLRGHFKDNPIMPGTLMLEAIGQLCVLHLLLGMGEGMARPADPKRTGLLSSESMRCINFCKPGDTLSMRIKPLRIRHPLGSYMGHMTRGQDKVAYVEELTLMFDYLPE